MPTPTYTLIDSVTLGSSASSVTFSGISAIGKGDLVVVINSLADSGTTNFTMRFNGATTGYSAITAYGNGSATGSFTSSSNLDLMAYGGNTTVPALVTATVLDFSETNKHKSVLSRGNRADQDSSMGAGRWADTAAVTSLTVITTTTNNYAAGSTFHLFQIVSE